MATVCKICGGSVIREGNYQICEYCGNRWEIDSANDVHAVERANAWTALRDSDFEKAGELFENILTKEPDNHEAYWGRALSLAGIVYVTDWNENKKVPTCNNITEASFLAGKDVQKAISLAPGDLAEGYRKQAEYIDRVRTEWLEKASKEPAYDVFLSFKDSDRENGIDRTQDSIDAQDLYNALMAEGYKVFFSRISLRDKVAEQYEPYIYNAIKTAKVMIVFGEKAEYFSSVWIRNEWSRFKTRIEKGEKHRNSLVVVYKNMNPGDLPAVLRARQCLNAGDMTFLQDLTQHIRRVVEESRRNVHLERIEIAGGQIAKKASALAVNSVKTREIGAGAIAETSLSEKQSISLIHTYLETRQWQEAQKLADDVLFDNPACAEAVWLRLMAKHQSATEEELVKQLDHFQAESFGSIEKALSCGSRDFAEKILVLLYDSGERVSDAAYKTLLETILPFTFPDRQKKIDAAFQSVTACSKFASFQVLLTTLDSWDVDKYIDYYQRYLYAATSAAQKRECCSSILRVDEGNLDALRAMVSLDLQAAKPLETILGNLETLLKYAPDANEEVAYCLDWLCSRLANNVHCAFAKELIRYHSGDISSLKQRLIKLSYRMINQSFFREAEYFLNLILSFDANNPKVYWAICLIKLEANAEDQIVSKDKFLKDVPEFNKYLALVDEARRRECILISQNQTEQAEQRRKDQIRKEISHLTSQMETLNREAALLVTEQVTPQPVWYWTDLTIFGSLLTTIGLIFSADDPSMIVMVLFGAAGLVGSFIYAPRKTPSKAVVKENLEKRNRMQQKAQEIRNQIRNLERKL